MSHLTTTFHYKNITCTKRATTRYLKVVTIAVINAHGKYVRTIC